MKPLIRIISVKSKTQKSFDEICDLYFSKIENFYSVEFINIKSVEVEREAKDLKIQKESELILNKLTQDEYVILLDEKGKFYSSREFAETLEKHLNLQKKVTFIIGGAFGVNETLKKRAQMTLALSSFVFNHMVAKIVLLEQIFRTCTLIHNVPYHND